jgi:hypothetical protein
MQVRRRSSTNTVHHRQLSATQPLR